jgi:hypothetical protein
MISTPTAAIPAATISSVSVSTVSVPAVFGDVEIGGVFDDRFTLVNSSGKCHQTR